MRGTVTRRPATPRRPRHHEEAERPCSEGGRAEARRDAEEEPGYQEGRRPNYQKGSLPSSRVRRGAPCHAVPKEYRVAFLPRAQGGTTRSTASAKCSSLRIVRAETPCSLDSLFSVFKWQLLPLFPFGLPTRFFSVRYRQPRRYAHGLPCRADPGFDTREALPTTKCSMHLTFQIGTQVPICQ